jgi:hypothetical protein
MPSKAKYYAPYMAKIDTKSIKIIDEKDTTLDAVYLNILPYTNITVKRDDIVHINNHKITKFKAFTKIQYQNHKNSLNDMWVIYQDKNIFAIPNYKIPKVPALKNWCVYFKVQNKYLCNDKYFLHNKNGDIKNKNVIVKTIALNKNFLNEKGEFYQIWLKGSFDQFSLLKDIDPNSFIPKLNFYNISNKQAIKWIKFGVTNPEVMNFLIYNNFSIVKNSTFKDVINQMDVNKFFKLVDISDIRVINGYLYHYKYNTNYKRFYHILKRYYNIKN